MAHEFKCDFKPGDMVVVGGDVVAVVERVIFARHSDVPMLALEWWDHSEVKRGEFHASEAQHCNSGD